MPIERGSRAPYTTTHCVTAVYEKHRQVGLRKINVEMMPRIGVAESLAGRTVQAMTLLDFYTEDGQVTAAFDGLRRMSDNEALDHLAGMLREAYAEVLQYIDPTTASFEEIERQFRVFEPTGQVARMVHLFIGLFVYVGVRPPAEESSRRTPTTARTGQRRTNSGSGGGRTRHAAGQPAQPDDQHVDGSNTTLPDDEVVPPPPRVPAFDVPSGERVEVKLGAAGTVTAYVDVRWLELPDQTFTKLRQAIRAIEDLAYEDSVPSSTGAATAGVDGERVS